MKRRSESVMETGEAILRKRKVTKDGSLGDLTGSPPSVSKGKPGQQSLQSTAVSSAQLSTNRSAGGSATFTTESLKMESHVREASDCDGDSDINDEECKTAKTGKTKSPETTQSTETECETLSPSKCKMSDSGDSCAKSKTVNSENETEDSTKQVEKLKQQEAKDAKSYYVCLLFFLFFAVYMRLFNIEIPDHVW